jgi:hypothetical protein
MLGRDHQKVSTVDLKPNLLEALDRKGLVNHLAMLIQGGKEKSPDLEAIAEAIEIFEQSRPLTEKT